MANIKPYTDQIQNAVYGEEVRGSIINALNKVNDDNNSYQQLKTDILDAKDAIDEQVDSFDAKVTAAQSTANDLQAKTTAGNTAKSQLETATTAANTAKTNLTNATTTANTAKANLETATTAANTAKTNADTARTNLEASTTAANTARTNLNSAKTAAETALTNLNAAISTAATSKSNLESVISSATTAKSQLQTVIDNSDTAKSDLSTVIAAANEMNLTLSATIITGTDLDTSLKSQNSQALSNINKLSDENFKADEILTGVEDIKAYLGYIDEDIVGICVDYKNKVFKRLAGAYGKTAGADFNQFEMFGGRKRCNVADDGTIVAYFGDDDDYIEDGSMGQVMVYQPAFYYKVVPLEYDHNTQSGIGYHLRKANYYVSTKPKTGFKLHPAFYDKNGNAVKYILLSAFEASLWSAASSSYVNDGTDNSTTWSLTADRICSVAGKKPISGLYKLLTKPNLETIASNRGDGWHGDLIKAESANQLLMTIELGMMNTQTAIGQGVVSITDNASYNCGSLTGSTSALGNGTGQAASTISEIGGVETVQSTSGKVSISYRGMENPWGNLWKHVNGINIWGDGKMGGGQPFVSDDFIFNESKNNGNYKPVGFTLANADGYINAMGYGGEEYDWLFMPSEVGGTSALPVGDYFYKTTDLNGYRIARLGGLWSSGGHAGGFYWYCDNGVGYRIRYIGGRLVYVPTVTV